MKPLVELQHNERCGGAENRAGQSDLRVVVRRVRLVFERHRAADERNEHHDAGAEPLGPDDHRVADLVNQDDEDESENQREGILAQEDRVRGDGERHRAAGDGELSGAETLERIDGVGADIVEGDEDQRLELE